MKSALPFLQFFAFNVGLCSTLNFQKRIQRPARVKQFSCLPCQLYVFQNSRILETILIRCFFHMSPWNMS